MKQKRKQLTLFLATDQSKAIEEIRAKFNPVQYELIKTHITLCREDEIDQLKQVLDNLSNLNFKPIDLQLGDLKRFSDGKGVFLPMKDNGQFQKLRKLILKGIIAHPRNHQPHITLMHPRNSTCTDEIFAAIKMAEFPAVLKLSRISLIEQEIGKKWEVLQEFELRKDK